MSNPYPNGQCTYGAAELAPWCLKYGNLGNAKDWASNWSSHGGFVTETPAVGSIACFQPGCDGATAPYGHVAVVTVVNGNTFTVDEMNGPLGPGRFDTRVCTMASCVKFLLENAQPQPTPQGDDKVYKLFAVANPTGGPMPIFMSDGQTFFHVQNDQQLNDVKYVWNPTVWAPDSNGYPTPVKDPGAFGVPVNQEAAQNAGLPWGG